MLDRFHGSSFEALVGGKFEQLSPGEAKLQKRIRKKVMETGERARTELRFVLDGSEHLFLVTYDPWRDESGKVIGVAGHAHELTLQELAMDRTQKMTEAVEMSPTAIVLTDLEGRIECVNPSLVKDAGFCDAADVIGKNVFDYTDEEGKIKIRKEIIPAIYSQGRWQGELTLRRAGDNIYIAEMICTLVRDDSGNPRFFLANFHNITERKRAEEALLLNDLRLEALQKLSQMEEASLQEITDFALEAGVKLTGSRVGYLAFVDREEKTLIMHSWSRKALQECGIDHKRTVYLLEDTGLWGEALRQRRAVITNDYSSCPQKRGAPPGHVEIIRHMNVPIIDKGRIVAVAGVGNKEVDYNDSDVRQLTLLMSGMWKLILRRMTEEELHRRDRLLQGVAQAASLLLTPDPDSIPKVLEILGKAADVDRVFIFENREAQSKEKLHKLLGEWPCIATGDNLEYMPPEDLSSEALFPGWYEILSAGETIQSLVSQASSPGREFLEGREIKSVLLEPIFIGGRFSAFIGFGDCRAQRHFVENDIALLKTVAGCIGEALMRRQTEEALKESQRTLSTLLSNLPGIAYRCRNDANRTMEFVSDGCMELTGYRAEDLIQSRKASYLQLIHPADADYVSSDIREALVERRPYRLIYRINALHGERWVWEQGRGIYGPKGDLLALEGFINDITERKLAEEALKRTHDELEKRVQKRTAWLLRANEALHEEMARHNKTEKELRLAQQAADAASRAKSEFLANMSHEIRTPMNAVIGLADILLETELTPEQRDFARTIHSSGDALLAIINDILDFSKIDEGKMELEDHDFNLQECINYSLGMVSARAAEKGLSLKREIDVNVPQYLKGDCGRLRQILTNLLSNAVKFTDRGQVVLKVCSGATPETIHFAVQDTGIGISAENIGKLFLSFSQIDTSTCRKYGGTGLGLAISRRLAELMGGKIWAESEPGVGSSFHFTIRAKPVPAWGDDLRFAGKRVLAVIGNEACLKGLMDLVRAWGMQIHPVVSAAEAQELTGSRFDVAVLDAELPGVHRLAEDLQARLPTIMLSGTEHEESSASPKTVRFCELQDAFREKLAERPRNPPGTSPSHKELRILLAEDNLVNRKVALLMLRKLGYNADVASNGLEVLQSIKHKDYDLILMDIQMPEMDGLKATRYINEMKLKKRPAILALTAYALEGDRERCLNAGMDGYISKPVQIEELRATLERLSSGIVAKDASP